MKSLPSVSLQAMIVCLTLWPATGFACNDLAAGHTLWIRLSSSVSSYSSKPGDSVTAILTEAVECDHEVIFPVGTQIDGVVRSVRKVGYGVRHETAAMEIQFDRVTPMGASPVSISAAVVEIDNAREQVTKGTIQGIRSSDTPQGRINSRLRHLPTFNPYSDAGLIVFKAAFPIFPEPEIYYPVGTDIRLKLTAPVSSVSPVPQPLEVDPPESMESMELESEARSLPTRTTTPAQVDADIVNLAFVGSREEIEDAFHEAGWVNSDTFTRHSFMLDFYAFLNNSGYAQAPMRPFLLDGKPEDMNWQKSLNSYARRDHLRMWQWPDSSNSQTVWLSASTHDSGAALSLKHHQFVHHIQPDIDEERSKVIRDLSAAGCVQGVYMVPRPGVANLTQNATGDPVRTDGELAIIELKPCQPVMPQLAEAPESANFKAGNHVFRYVRRQILTFRSDIWRANIIYGAYDLGRMSVNAMRHHPLPAPYPDAHEVEQARSNSIPTGSDSRKSPELPFTDSDDFR